jgi:hypothetical protein
MTPLTHCWLVARPVVRAIRRTVIVAPRRIVRAVATPPTLVCVTLSGAPFPAGPPAPPPDAVVARAGGSAYPTPGGGYPYGAGGYLPGLAGIVPPISAPLAASVVPLGLLASAAPVVPVGAPQPVPEPSALALLLAGLAALIWRTQA